MDTREQQAPKRSWLVLVAAVSTAVHVGVLSVASLFPSPPPEPARFVRIEVMQFHQYGEADSDDWSHGGRIFATVSNEKLRASNGD